jgi:hypothetical protein
MADALRSFAFLGEARLDSISLRLNPSDFTAALQFLSDRDVKIAATWALNDTADDVLTDIKNRMDVVFDRPTRFTKNAFMVVKARPDALEATVQERRANAGRDYLKIQETGGARRQTGFEHLLSRSLAYDGVIQSIIPADDARLDAYGNWSKGERNQVLSALQAQRDGTANTTERSKKRNRNRATYFVPKHSLTPGIYKRTAGGDIGIVALISPKVPVYHQRLGFLDHAETVWKAKLPVHLNRTLSKMFLKRLG